MDMILKAAVAFGPIGQASNACLMAPWSALTKTWEKKYAKVFGSSFDF